MKILIVKRGEYAQLIETEDINASIASAIGGVRVDINPFEQKKDVCLVMGAKHQMLALAFNRIIETPEERLPVYGPFVVCQKQNGKYIGLTDEQAQEFNEKYHFPQKSFYDSILDINFYTDYDPTEKQKAAKEKGQREDREHGNKER